MADITTMVDIICDAITNHRQIVCDVNGYHRVACPHLLGRKNGEWHVLVWQVNDDSEKGFEPGAPRWRCLELEDMQNLSAQDGEWHRGWTTGRGRQYCVDEHSITAQIDPDHAAEIRNT